MNKFKEKIAQGLTNLTKVHLFLETWSQKPELSDAELAGLIKHFELAYEISWKLLQKMAQSQGRHIASPRESFRFALEAGLIDLSDEQQWLDMIEDRNLAVHIYSQEQALELRAPIRDTYRILFGKLIAQASKATTSNQ